MPRVAMLREDIFRDQIYRLGEFVAIRFPGVLGIGSARGLNIVSTTMALLVSLDRGIDLQDVLDVATEDECVPGTFRIRRVYSTRGRP